MNTAVNANMNIAIVEGTVSAEPRITELASGSTVHNYDISTLDGAGTRLTVPVAWPDPARPPALTTGDEVLVVGSVRRRWFRAGGGTQSRTEVVARVVARRGSARARREIDAAARAIGTGEPAG